MAPTKDLPRDLPESTVAYILFTSGTTSRPKGVEITHRSLAAQMETFVRHYGLDDRTRLVNVLPLHHTDGLTQGVTVTLAAAATLFASPRHHYTAGLLRSVPGDREIADHGRLVEIPGMVPSLADLPNGCKFSDRCAAVEPLCRSEEPPLVQLGTSLVRCHYPLDPPS